MAMRIVSYNCRGLPNQPDQLYSRPGVVEIVNNNDVDILCLQETWHTKQDLASLNNLHRKLRRFALAFIHSHSGATGVFAMLLWKFVAEATSCLQKTLQTT